MPSTDTVARALYDAELAELEVERTAAVQALGPAPLMIASTHYYTSNENYMYDMHVRAINQNTTQERERTERKMRAAAFAWAKAHPETNEFGLCAHSERLTAPYAIRSTMTRAAWQATIDLTAARAHAFQELYEAIHDTEPNEDHGGYGGNDVARILQKFTDLAQDDTRTWGERDVESYNAEEDMGTIDFVSIWGS